MIVTLTMNPSVDRQIDVATLQRGEVHRELRSHVDPGGKGVNVALAVAANGLAATAVFPEGGAQGHELSNLLRQLDLAIVPVPIRESVRTNIALVEPDGTVTKVNARGPRLGADEVQALIDATLDATTDATWIAACGSLPPGVDDDFYAGLTVAARTRGLNVAVDTSGAALEAVLAAGPDVIKPNDEELEAVTGRRIATFGDAIDAARELIGRGARTVLASLGPDGALLVDATTAHHAVAEVAVPRSTVGAGDATLAGYLANASLGPAEALRHAVAWGTAAVGLPGSRMPRPQDIDLASVESTDAPDPARPVGGLVAQATEDLAAHH